MASSRVKAPTLASMDRNMLNVLKYLDGDQLNSMIQLSKQSRESLLHANMQCTSRTKNGTRCMKMIQSGDSDDCAGFCKVHLIKAASTYYETKKGIHYLKLVIPLQGDDKFTITVDDVGLRVGIPGGIGDDKWWDWVRQETQDIIDGLAKFGAPVNRMMFGTYSLVHNRTNASRDRMLTYLLIKYGGVIESIQVNEWSKENKMVVATMLETLFPNKSVLIVPHFLNGYSLVQLQQWERENLEA